VNCLRTIFAGVFALILIGCDKAPTSTAETQTTIRVFSAASLTESFTDVAKQFSAENSGIVVQFNFAGSQELRAQLENGASADLFASANAKEMETAKSELLVDPQTVRAFAGNRLVVICPQSNPAKLQNLADLTNAGVKIDLADVSVPVGEYADQMLDEISADARYSADYKKRFLANVVSREENVKSVLNKVRLGEVDAGVVYVTDVTPDAAKHVGTIEIPDAFNQVATYPIAIVAKPGNVEAARKFEDFVLSAAGQAILRRYNFLPAPAVAQR
jgi:molybdate transport system substrate-binding protein